MGPNPVNKNSKVTKKDATANGVHKKATKVASSVNEAGTSSKSSKNKQRRSTDSGGDESQISGGQTSALRTLPVSKVRHIMVCSPNSEEHKITGEAVAAMCRAAEAFVELLAQGAQGEVMNRSKISYNDLAQFVQSREELSFIQDIIPRKLPYSEVSKTIRKKSRH